MAIDIPTALLDKLTGSYRKHPRLSLRVRIALLCVIWVVALFPFVVLNRTTWFGRPLSDQQIGEYLHANEKPSQIEYALGQIRQRMSRHDSSVSIWYPDLVRLSSHPLEHIRATDATVMGENAVLPELHDALLSQLTDSSSIVRFNAAASLARSGDPTGYHEIISTLTSSSASPEQIVQALAALSYIGTDRDLPLVAQYEAPSPDISGRVRQQAITTAGAIHAHSSPTVGK